MLKMHSSLTLSAVLLSATVISSPSQASILPPTPSEHRDLLSTISLAVTDGVKLPQLEHRDLVSTISLAQIDGRGGSPLKRRQLASVCFITDAGDCGGIEWSENTELDNAEKCRNEGYVDTPCGAGLIPIGTCPYDSNWHSKCGCPSDYDKTCTGADEQGKGDSCEGKYQECCNLCTGYDYTADNIPSGYVKTDSCESCDGTKYKARCDVSEGGYMDCGDVVGVGGSCTDDSGTYYKQCNCPLNYEWNDETKTCTCSTSFKYDCQGSGYATTQTGNTCDNKYSSCDCAEGFVWDGESGMCVCDGVDWCALNQDCTALGYAQQTCPKWSIKCPYDTSFVECIDCPPSFSEECSGAGQVGEGQSCGGKYRSCTCASGYEWKDGACQQKAPDYSGCTVGALFYSDNTCSNNLESGKTLLGVVIMEKTTSTSGWIMTVKPIQTNIKWSTEYVDIQEITNCTSTSCLTDIQSSCTNTDIITNYGDSSTYPAAWAAKNYNPSGTPSGKSWCLPSGGLLNKALNNSTNLAKINAGIITAGGTKIGNVYNSNEYVWSSSEYISSGGWSFYADANGLFYMFNYNPISFGSSYSVRPVMEFGDDAVIPPSCDASYQYTCTGTGYSGGSGTACGGKYTSCTCANGYEWKNGSCQEILNGAQGELYYCNGTVVGVRATGMGFYVAMKDLGRMNWSSANSQCQSYAFCGNVKGTLPTKDQLLSIYKNKSRVNTLLSTNGGTQLTNHYYWSSTDNGGSSYYLVVMSNGNVGNDYHLNRGYYVRPVLASW